MAVDMFLKLEKIPGEAADKTHKEEIDVLSWSWGASQSGTTHIGSGSGSGKASFQDISVTKYIDKSSHLLLQHLSKGTHIPTGKLTVRKAGDNPLEYITIDLTDVIITSVSTGGSGGEDRLTENVTLNFREFKYIYKEQDKTGAQLGGDMQFGFNIAENVPV